MILASQSPRRKELLSEAGFEFSVVPSDFDETSVQADNPVALVSSLAEGKAHSVSQVYPHEIVIGSDTVVVMNNEVLGKPVSASDAMRMLRMLSGSTHTVHTAVCIAKDGETLDAFVSSTDVTFWDLDDDEIRNYVESGDPLDKAGSYGIQSAGGRMLVRSISGDYCTVIGLPISELARRLKPLGELPKGRR